MRNRPSSSAYGHVTASRHRSPRLERARRRHRRASSHRDDLDRDRVLPPAARASRRCAGALPRVRASRRRRRGSRASMAPARRPARRARRAAAFHERAATCTVCAYDGKCTDRDVLDIDDGAAHRAIGTDAQAGAAGAPAAAMGRSMSRHLRLNRRARSRRWLYRGGRGEGASRLGGCSPRSSSHRNLRRRRAGDGVASRRARPNRRILQFRTDARALSGAFVALVAGRRQRRCGGAATRSGEHEQREFHVTSMTRRRAKLVRPSSS